MAYGDIDGTINIEVQNPSLGVGSKLGRPSAPCIVVGKVVNQESKTVDLTLQASDEIMVFTGIKFDSVYKLVTEDPIAVDPIVVPDNSIDVGKVEVSVTEHKDMFLAGAKANGISFFSIGESKRQVMMDIARTMKAHSLTGTLTLA